MSDSVTVTFDGQGGMDSLPPIAVPARLGHVRLLHEIGRGGMSVVWKGIDEFLNRNVAIKLLHHSAIRAETEIRRQFLEGARAAAAVKHPYIVSVFHADEIDGMMYIVMEYVEGFTLAEVLQRNLRIEHRPAALMIARMIQALSVIHEAQVIHRDLKPSNVLFNRKGDLLVSDFGLSYQKGRLNGETHTTSGTPPYMAPETFTGDSSFQSDIYAVGIIYYELLTQQRPFTGRSILEYHLKHLNDPLPMEPLLQAGIGEDVREIIQRAIHKKKMFRYKSATHILQAIEGLYPDLLNDVHLDNALKHYVLDYRPKTPDSHQSDLTKTPQTPTYFDVLSQRADQKRLQKRPPPTEKK